MGEFGTESCYNTVDTTYNAVAMLDSTHVVVAYTDAGGDDYGCAKVGTIANNTVTWGTENCFNSAITEYVSIDVLDSTHFVVAYCDQGGDDYGCARIGSVSGTTISYGAENIFNSAITGELSVAAFDSTHFVVCYNDVGDSRHGTARVGLTNGGTTISSYGTENEYSSSGSTSWCSVAILDSTHFVVGYDYSGGSVRVGVISGTTITSYGATSVFNSLIATYISVDVLDSTHFVVAFRDIIDSSRGAARVGVVSGTTVTGYGTKNTFSTGSTSYISTSALDSTHFVVAYADAGVSGYGTTIPGSISGTTITYGTIETFNSESSIHLSLATLSTTSYIVVYKDNNVSGYGGCSRIWYESAGVSIPVFIHHYGQQGIL